MSQQVTKSPGATAGEIASLAERMGYLQVLRACFAVTVLASALFAEKVIGASFADLTLVTGGYLFLSATAEGLRRIGRGRGLTVIFGMLLVDGIYLAWILYSTTSGAQSPLRFLVYLHLIAVTLLASYRTGLKIALWHSLLFFVVFYAQAADILAPVDNGSAAGNFERPSLFNVVVFWLVAIGTAVFSAINERELRRRKTDLEALTTMARDLENVEDAPGAAEVLLDAVGETFEFKRGVVLASPKGGDLSMLAFRGPGEAPEAKSGIDAVVRRAWDERTHILVKQLDAEADPQLATLLPFARNLVVQPLFAEGEPLGVLVVEHPKKAGTKIERRVVDMVGQFSAHAALALRSAWLLGEVQRLADTDGLTGVANRRTFEQVLEKEVSRAGRNGEPVTLIMFDIDHFKKLNDNHGHQLGDEVLRRVGTVLSEGCRDFDIAARYGGEEFAMILPGCSSKESLVVAERLRRSICDYEMPVEGITASSGVATFPTHAGDPQKLIAAADEALYESKRAGRDRVTRSRRRTQSAPAKLKQPSPDSSSTPTAEETPSI